jgi:DNA-binding CsgD family transcriptional regulator
MRANEKSTKATRREAGRRAASRNGGAAGLGSLTPREREVLAWLVEGKRDGEIAAILGASVNTIHKHVQHILAKLGVETRTAAACWALGHGFKGEGLAR